MFIKPVLRLFDLTMIIISMVIGIGIFRNPSVIAVNAGSENIFFLAWIIGALVSVCGALTFAEIGSRFPVAGGFYKMFSVCYRPQLAFILIWTYILLNAGSTAAVALTGAQYIAPIILPESMRNPTGEKLLFFIIIGILFFLNFLGIRMGSRTQNILSTIKIGLMLVLISALFFIPIHDHKNIEAVSTSDQNFFKALGISLIGVFFSYGGYQNTANLGADVKAPQKNMPRAILAAMGLVMILYLVINFAYIKVLGFHNVQASPLIAADLAKVLFGNGGAAFASIVIFISVLGFVNTVLLHNPRVMYAMAEEKILPPVFMKLNERKQVQEFALIFYTSLTVIMFLFLQTYSDLLNYVIFNDTISLAFAAFCIFIFRRKKTGDHIPGFRLKWFPFIPVVFILMQLTVTAYVVYSDPLNSFIGFIIMLCGFPVYYLLKNFSNRRSAEVS
ncbi:MAG: amino acid permease [Chitinophagales bacterium]|nr:amino acid permease [Chitinophagales bacterium]